MTLEWRGQVLIVVLLVVVIPLLVSSLLESSIERIALILVCLAVSLYSVRKEKIKDRIEGLEN